MSPTASAPISLWIEFFTVYWHHLSPEQKEFYIGQMKMEAAPPKAVDFSSLEGWEQENLMKHMGEVIQKYRRKKKMPQKEFADLMGKKTSHMSLIESGVKMFTSVDLARAVKLLSIPPRELFLIEDSSS